MLGYGLLIVDAVKMRLCYGFSELSCCYYKYCLLERKWIFLLGCVDGVALPMGTGPRLVYMRKVQVAGIWCSKFLMAATTQKRWQLRRLLVLL